MTMWEFMATCPWLGLVVTLAGSFTVFVLAGMPFMLVQRWIRHLDIHEHGWPPVHCDADGDAVEDEE